MKGFIMMMSLRNNLMVDRAIRNMNLNMDMYSNSIMRLSSGLRINSASDDPAGAAIAGQFESDIVSLRAQSKNTELSLSSLEIKEGALNEMQSTLVRMQQLANQAATGSYSAAQRNIMNNEFEQLKEEYAWISNSTEFNGNGLFGKIDVNPEQGQDPSSDPFAGISLSDMASAGLALANIGDMIEEKSSQRASVGTEMNIAHSKIQQLDIQAENLSEAKSRITDVDIAEEMVRMTKSQVLVQASIAVIKTASEMSKMALKLLN